MAIFSFRRPHLMSLPLLFRPSGEVQDLPSRELSSLAHQAVGGTAAASEDAA